MRLHMAVLTLATACVYLMLMRPQMPGWSGLANARVTMFGDVYQLSDDLQRGAREVCCRGTPLRTFTADVFPITSFRLLYVVGGQCSSKARRMLQLAGRNDVAR